MASVKPIRTALCGFGLSGRVFHAPFLKVSPRYNLTAILERTKNESKKSFPEVKIFRNIDELLRDEEIELVIVNTPNSTHFEFAREALKAGKHVVVEKPFTITVREGIQLKKLADKKGKILSVYQNRRYDSDYRTIKKLLNKGYLGKLAEVEMRFDRYKLHPGNKMHKETPGPGTGNLYDLGSHLLDQAIQLFGMPVEIFADIDIIREDSRVDDYFEVLLFYPSLRVRIHSTYLAMKELPGYVFFGTTGSFVKPKTNIQEERLSLGELPVGKSWGAEPQNEYGILSQLRGKRKTEKRIISEKGNYMDYYNQLYTSIREGGRVPVTAEDGMKVIHLIELAYKSSRQKKILPVNEIFS